MEESLLWGLCLSSLKFIYLGFLAWICSRKEKEEKRETKKNPSRKEKGKKRKEKKIIAWSKLAKGETGK
jgi:hypothetical protein